MTESIMPQATNGLSPAWRHENRCLSKDIYKAMLKGFCTTHLNLNQSVSSCVAVWVVLDPGYNRKKQ